MKTLPNPNIETDRALIDRLGGPAKLANMLGFKKPGAIQRIQNWKTRGIPSLVKLSHPTIFLSHLRLPDERQSDAPTT